MVGVAMGKRMVYIYTCQHNRGDDEMTHKLDIEWTGTSYTDQIDNLSEALAAAESYIEGHGFTDETQPQAELIFARIAFEGWMEWPDNWTLTVN
jgi:hypothetical protein